MAASPWWFPIGREVAPQDLVGREPFLGDVAARVRLGESLVISAPRRTGKTSVVREALRRLAAGAPPYRDAASTPVSRALAALSDAAILRRVDRGRYEFPEPMFADWLRRAQA